MFDPVIFVIVAIILTPIIFLQWKKQKKEIGKIKCNRCKFSGKAKGDFVPFKGVKPVCPKCGSEDWKKID